MDTVRNLRTFYLLVFSQIFSLIGSRISTIAISFWLFEKTGEATPLILVHFFAIIPQLITSNISGLLADRWDRRSVMVIADIGQVIGSLFLLFSFVYHAPTDSFPLWQLYLVAFIQAIFSVFQTPALNASVTMLVPDKHRVRANSIMQMQGPLSGLVAPAVAGMTYAFLGVIGSMIIDLLTFIVATVVILLVRIPNPPETAAGRALRGSLFKEIFGGFTYLYAMRPLFWLVMTFTAVNLLFSAAGIVTLPYLLARTGGDHAAYGVISSLSNLGAVLGGIAIGIWGGTRPRIHTILPAVILGAIMMTLAGMTQSIVLMGALYFLMMFPFPASNAMMMALIQTKVAPDLQGRVFGVLMQLSMLFVPISYLFVGPLVDRVLEPAVTQPGWAVLAPFVGSGAGSGIGLLLVICGSSAAILSLAVYLLPMIQNMEKNLPDYAATPAPQPVIALEEPATATA